LTAYYKIKADRFSKSIGFCKSKIYEIKTDFYLINCLLPFLFEYKKTLNSPFDCWFQGDNQTQSRQSKLYAKNGFRQIVTLTDRLPNVVLLS
jgi:hypothetical protein